MKVGPAMKMRIALWALSGAVVVCFWTILMLTFPGLNIGRSLVVRITIPFAFIGRHFHLPLTYYWTAVLNGATYAVLGLAVEPFYRLRPHRSSGSSAAV